MHILTRVPRRLAGVAAVAAAATLIPAAALARAVVPPAWTLHRAIAPAPRNRPRRELPARAR